MQVYIPKVNQIWQVIVQMTVTYSSSHDSENDVGLSLSRQLHGKSHHIPCFADSSSEHDCIQDVNAGDVGDAVSVMIANGQKLIVHKFKKTFWAFKVSHAYYSG